MKLLQEVFDTQNIITEGKDGAKKHYITGIFAQAETGNRNKRFYSKSVMERAVNEYLPLIQAKRSCGEFNHPTHPQVNLERASHIIESLKWDGNNVIGKARVLGEMPMGKIAIGLINEGVQIGVSTRGLGSLIMNSKTGLNEVQNDFTMTAIDIVGDPSAPDAWVQGIMEGAEWIYEAASGSWVLAEQAKSKLKTMSAVDVANKQAQMFESFLNSLK